VRETMRAIAGAALLLALTAGTAAAQTASVSCTDATNTNCTVKKNQPFQITADPALATDSILTEKFRLYMDGAQIQEQQNTGAAPLFTLSAGISVAGQHTFFLESVATTFSSTGQQQEIQSGPSNVLTVNVVTGSLSAPKNLRVVGQGGGL
jgi:hypothetical protein